MLDLGCGVAQELRHLIHSNDIPSSSLYGLDVSPYTLSSSYALFCDSPDTTHITLAAHDILSSSPLPWTSKFTVIHASLFLHLFTWREQVTICSKIVSLLKNEKGCLLVGEMVGIRGGGVRGGRANWMHDACSWADLWKEVAKITGTERRWKVRGNLEVW